MLDTLHALKDMLGTIVALMALLAVAYGVVIRSFARTGAAQALLGALFGGAAALAMADPLHVVEGVIVDLRHVPLVLAGAFLGGPGAIVATLVALAARIGIGGMGMVAGATGVLVSGLAGLAWASFYQHHPCQGRRSIVLLAALSLLQLPTWFLIPWEVARPAVTAVWPILVPFQLAGVLAVGTLLERERAIAGKEERLAQVAARDPLTGLLNRRGFEAAVARLPKATWGSALLLLDLDHFKRVNDRHGHAAGDAVLQALGARLGQALRCEDVIARFGGEEMVVFLPDLEPHGVKATAARLCEAVRSEPFMLPDGTSVRVTVSVGGAWTGGQVRLNQLAARADAALYAAKDAGRDRWRVDANGSLAGAPSGASHPALRQVAAA